MRGGPGLRPEPGKRGKHKASNIVSNNMWLQLGNTAPSASRMATLNSASHLQEIKAASIYFCYCQARTEVHTDIALPASRQARLPWNSPACLGSADEMAGAVARLELSKRWLSLSFCQLPAARAREPSQSFVHHLQRPTQTAKALGIDTSLHRFGTSYLAHPTVIQLAKCIWQKVPEPDD